MSVTPVRTNVHDVRDQTGANVKARRTAIGMSVNALAKRAGVDRGSLTALEAGGSVRDTTLAAVERTLAELEHELGMDVPTQVAIPAQAKSSEGLIEFDITGDFGVHVVVKGPVVDADLLRRQAAALIAEIRGKRSDED